MKYINEVRKDKTKIENINLYNRNNGKIRKSQEKVDF